MRKQEILSTAQVEQFERDGFVHLRGAVDQAVADEVVDALLVKLAWEQGFDSRHPKEFRAVVGRQQGEPFSKLNTPTFLRALDDLLLPTRYCAKHIESHGCFFFSFPGFDRAPWRPPFNFGPWHIDLGHADATEYDLTSANCALVPIFLLTKTQSGGGATVIVPGSHRAVAKLLYAAGGALPRFHVTAYCEHVVTESRKTLEVTGDAGDLYILHPFLIHSASANCSDQMRVICNTGVGLEGPRRWMQMDEEPSLVDLAVRNSIAETLTPELRPRSVRRALALNYAACCAKHLAPVPWHPRHSWGSPTLAGACRAVGGLALRALDWVWESPLQRRLDSSSQQAHHTASGNNQESSVQLGSQVTN